MQFETWDSFIAMGGYGFYVWLAFGITFGCMLWLVIGSIVDSRKLETEVRKETARKSRIKAAQQQANGVEQI